MTEQPAPQQPPSAAQAKRNRPPRKHNHNNSVPRLDGAVSDNVSNANPRSKKPPRQQQQRQSVAAGAGPAQNGHTAHVNGNERARPASVGGPMLPHTTPGKEKAYAGPTFQASPAASRLPMPSKFFSKSVPSAAPPGSMQARLEGEKTPEEASSPEQDTVSPSQTRPEAGLASPLDMFFNADKAEREKRGSATLSPASAANRRPVDQKSPFQASERSVFMQELDDQPMLSPKTAIQNQRPQVGERAHSSPGIVPQSNGDFGASTQALKDMLFKNLNSPPPVSTPPRDQRPQSSGSGSESPSPFQRPGSGYGPSTPDPQQNYHYGNRNLSPMFKAARAETPTRPSNLRQQYGQSPYQQYPQYGQSPDDFSRGYLDQHIRSSMPTQPPPGLISNRNSVSSESRPGPPQRQSSTNGTNGASGPLQTANRDVQDMSNDLRRMLNLNALG